MLKCTVVLFFVCDYCRCLSVCKLAGVEKCVRCIVYGVQLAASAGREDVNSPSLAFSGYKEKKQTLDDLPFSSQCFLYYLLSCFIFSVATI